MVGASLTTQSVAVQRGFFFEGPRAIGISLHVHHYTAYFPKRYLSTVQLDLATLVLNRTSHIRCNYCSKVFSSFSLLLYYIDKTSFLQQ